MVVDWTTITLEALEKAWQGIIGFLPNLIASIVLFLIGWLISCALGKLTAEILLRLGFDKLFERTGWKDVMEKAELKVGPSEFTGAIVKWISVIIVLLISVEALGFSQFASLLNQFILWLPNLVVAIAIFLVAIILADILDKLVVISVKKVGIKYAEFLGEATKWTVYIFSLLIILLQLGVAETVINAFIIGFIAMISLAFGLAFGLGGKDAAAQFIEELKKKISEK